MEKTEEKRSLREERRLIWRAIKLWQTLVPGVWMWSALSQAVNAVSPYFGLWMSARIVNELSGDCEIRTLAALAVITVAGTFFLSMLGRFLKSRSDLSWLYVHPRHMEYVGYTQNAFPFAHTEDPDVLLKSAEIEAANSAFEGGLVSVRRNAEYVIQHALNIVLSVSLAFSMFTLRGEGESDGFLGFLNSPLSALALAVLVGVIAFLHIRGAAATAVRLQEAVSELPYENTRAFAFFRQKGSDMILFNLNRVVLAERRQRLHPKWAERMADARRWSGSRTAVLNAALNIAVFIFVAGRAYAGAFGIGSFILYQGAVTRFVNGFSALASCLGALRYNNGHLVKLYEYLDLPNEMYKGSLAVEKRDDLDYEIEFRDVSFQYPRTDAWALRHVNMKFRIGEKLAIVGENGSGKTTFIKLLCRLYDPTEGKILLNGIDVTRYRFDEYMGLFSVVFQDYTLFDFPLGDNVAASMDYDRARVRDCLIRAGMGEKLKSLDAEAKERGRDALDLAVGRGYDSEGMDLSGGERQKTALARALYKDAPFVILDEPTAALDPIAEAAVYEDFNKIAEDKTTVFISHRLSSCKFCDEIVVFDHGSIVQKGSHEELAADKTGKYHALWTAQAQYYTAG